MEKSHSYFYLNIIHVYNTDWSYVSPHHFLLFPSHRTPFQPAPLLLSCLCDMNVCVPVPLAKPWSQDYSRRYDFCFNPPMDNLLVEQKEAFSIRTNHQWPAASKGGVEGTSRTTSHPWQNSGRSNLVEVLRKSQLLWVNGCDCHIRFIFLTLFFACIFFLLLLLKTDVSWA